MPFTPHDGRLVVPPGAAVRDCPDPLIPPRRQGVVGGHRRWPPSAKLFAAEPSVGDIAQGKVGDCTALSILAAVVAHTDGPALVQGMVVRQTSGANDRFVVRLYDDVQRPVFIAVPARLAFVTGATGEWRAFARGAPWVGAVEKALACLGGLGGKSGEGGNYDAIDGISAWSTTQALLGPSWRFERIADGLPGFDGARAAGAPITPREALAWLLGHDTRFADALWAGVPAGEVATVASVLDGAALAAIRDAILERSTLTAERLEAWIRDPDAPGGGPASATPAGADPLNFAWDGASGVRMAVLDAENRVVDFDRTKVVTLATTPRRTFNLLEGDADALGADVLWQIVSARASARGLSSFACPAAEARVRAVLRAGRTSASPLTALEQHVLERLRAEVNARSMIVCATRAAVTRASTSAARLEAGATVIGAIVRGGLVPNHAHAVLGLDETAGQAARVRLFNPWGAGTTVRGRGYLADGTAFGDLTPSFDLHIRDFVRRMKDLTVARKVSP